MAAHDLKTPLTPVRLTLAALKMEPNQQPAHRARVEMLERNVLRFERLIEDLLDAARLQAGRLQLRLEDVDLAATAREITTQFTPAAREDGLTLSADLPAQAPIRADALRVLQVVTNLVSNALRYTPRGGHVTVRVVPGTLAGGTKAWRIEVEDTGLGLTQDQQAKLFQAFVRLHEQPGVPKGLFISKGILDQHGGAIGAESRGPGKGSRFHATFPVAGPPAGAPQGSASTHPADS